MTLEFRLHCKQCINAPLNLQLAPKVKKKNVNDTDDTGAGFVLDGKREAEADADEVVQESEAMNEHWARNEVAQADSVGARAVGIPARVRSGI